MREAGATMEVPAPRLRVRPDGPFLSVYGNGLKPKRTRTDFGVGLRSSRLDARLAQSDV